MTVQFSPPPTYAEVVLSDTDGKHPRFNPIWLKWFIDLASLLTTAGGGVGTGFAHNSLTGLQGGTTGQEYHLTAAEYSAIAANVAGPASAVSGNVALFDGTTGKLLKDGGVYGVWTAYTTARTGWTDVGAPTVTAENCTVNHICYFQIKVIPGTTVATAAGTSYCSLPTTAAGIGGVAAMYDLTTNISVGGCGIDVVNSRVYVPAQAATADTLIIAGFYEV